MSLIQTDIKKHVACSYGYKLKCAGDKFSKPFKSCSGEMLITILFIACSKKVFQWRNGKTF